MGLYWGLVSGPEAKLVEEEGTRSPALPLPAQTNSQATDLGPLSAGGGRGRALLHLPLWPLRTRCDGCQGAWALFGDKELGRPLGAFS